MNNYDIHKLKEVLYKIGNEKLNNSKKMGRRASTNKEKHTLWNITKNDVLINHFIKFIKATQIYTLFVENEILLKEINNNNTRKQFFGNSN